MATDIATHDAPAWGNKANFLIMADLSTAGLQGRWEQLWAQQIADGDFVICCIPYFTYGLALGDVVHTIASGAKSHVVAEVIKRSGRRVLRLWLKHGSPLGKERVYQHLAHASPLHEWSSDNLVAIDVADDERMQQGLRSFVDYIRRFGIEAEWGD